MLTLELCPEAGVNGFLERFKNALRILQRAGEWSDQNVGQLTWGLSLVSAGLEESDFMSWFLWTRWKIVHTILSLNEFYFSLVLSVFKTLT